MKTASFVALAVLRVVAAHEEHLNLLQIQSTHLATEEPALDLLEKQEPDWRGKTDAKGYPCQMQTGDCKAWGPGYLDYMKLDYFSYKYEKYGFPGLGCTDKSGAPRYFNSLSETPTNCSFAFDKNIVGQFNKHFADFGGCASGSTISFRHWVVQWHSARLVNHPKKTGPNPKTGYKNVPVVERAEACRMDAEEMDECAGANIYEIKTTGNQVYCACGLAIQIRPASRPDEMTCLLKSKPIADLAAPGATASPPGAAGRDAEAWLPTIKRKGSKSTFKMSTNFTGCSKGWWHITGERRWSNNLYHPTAWPPVGLLTSASRGAPHAFTKLVHSSLPSDCVEQYRLVKDFPPTAPWPQSKGCKGAVGLMMNGVHTNPMGGPQRFCTCIFPKEVDKLDWAEVATYAYPNYGQTLHEPDDKDMWVCALDDEDPTGGDDVYPIPDWSGVVSPDGPKPKPSCAPIPSLNLANVSTSNLGGQGPGESGMRFSQVGKYKDVDIDLKLTSAGPYTAFNADQNGLSGSLGTVNVKAGTKVDVVFAVVESGTDTPVAVDGLSLKFLDVDEGKRGRQRSTVTACNAEVELDALTELTQVDSGSCTSVSSSKKGSKHDNPTSVDNLTDVQKAKVVTFTYGAGAQFQASLSIAASPKSPTGRNFNFAVGILCK